MVLQVGAYAGQVYLQWNPFVVQQLCRADAG